MAGVLVLTVTSANAQRRHQATPPKQNAEPKAHDDEEEDHGSLLRTEPTVEPPANPLVVSPEVQRQLGTDWASGAPSPEGPLSQKRWFPYYEERQGDYRLRLLPPFMLEHTRGLVDPTQRLYGVPKAEDTEGLYGLLYYRRRSPQLDM